MDFDWEKSRDEEWAEVTSKDGAEERIGPRGHTFWRKPNGAGGHTYISDSVACGAVVWDTCLNSPEDLEFVLAWEREGVVEPIEHVREDEK